MSLKKNKKSTSLRIETTRGGIGGSTAALKLSLDVSLFEKRESLVNGQPICHLHVGGNLYREISRNNALIDFVSL